MIGSASEHLLQLVLQDNFTGSQASLNIDLTSNKKERDKLTERERERETGSQKANRNKRRDLDKEKETDRQTNRLLVERKRVRQRDRI